MSDELDETRRLWDAVAADWRVQVGREGDRNRRLNSDPVLWEFLGDVRGLRVLDAGCGTGYFCGLLRQRGAEVTGVDLSSEMIAIAERDHPEIKFRVDSCTELATVADASIDRLVSNYVLMDLPDLTSAVRSFYRALCPGGEAALAFSHPCFPFDFAEEGSQDTLSYHWRQSYFERRKEVAPPWGHFTEEFLWFHRPLSDYFRAFRSAGFDVLDLVEPRLTPDRQQLAKDETERRRAASIPLSIAIRLRRPM
ncbi:class I SAM-dependent methyltransferase [Stratiformator vulcanicus]|uniref:Malonyl-[acyl-carrier protein] O-methyltransferase n=1 Tax=Stratiformator vulcanicus TaxID=2527980 RepID=A0A517R611_9PLAN|nr:class I SAM-dependent methyltransferase [Stratiformator vulcanicus]QDT39311.1 Malonyl-[acyl-carrier protein] O-methyltransferase [Stratiformator vulcanicus]